MLKIQFNKDFAGRKKGEVMEVDSMTATNLEKRKIARKVKEKKKRGSTDK